MKKVLAIISTTLALISLASCSNANIESTTGIFDGSYEATDSNGNVDTYYNFKSNNNTVWWMLTETEIGFTPKANTEYVLTYNNNGTTKANKPCDCDPELDCECEVYDDVLVCVERK